MEVIVCICVLKILNIYICFIFSTNILACKLLFFIVFTLSLHLHEFMRVFPYSNAGQCAAMACRNRNMQLQIYFKISSKLQFFHERQKCSNIICFRLFVEFFCNFIFLLYSVESWRCLAGKTGTKEELLYQLFILSLEFKQPDSA